MCGLWTSGEWRGSKGDVEDQLEEEEDLTTHVAQLRVLKVRLGRVGARRGVNGTQPPVIHVSRMVFLAWEQPLRTSSSRCCLAAHKKNNWGFFFSHEVLRLSLYRENM